MKGMTSFSKVFLALFKVYAQVGKRKLGPKLFTPKLIQLLHLLSIAGFGTSLKMFWKEEICEDGGGYDRAFRINVSIGFAIYRYQH